VMLPSVLAWNLKVNFESQRRVASAMGRDDGDAAKAVSELVIALQQPSRLRDVGVNRTQFSAIAKGAMQNMMVRSNPRPILSESDIYEILEIAW
jgi:maleylacetate reductase